MFYCERVRECNLRSIVLVMCGHLFFGQAHVMGTTFYAAPEFATTPDPQGLSTNDGLSLATPFLIDNFWAVAQPGDTLSLMDGRYTGNASMIRADTPVNLNGTALDPITIRALNDGKVTIDGEGLRRTVIVRGERFSPKTFWVLEGFNACNSRYEVVLIKDAEDIIVRRVCAWNASPDLNNHVLSFDSTFRCVFEDCAAWGTGRKLLHIFSSAWLDNNVLTFGRDNVLRRVWCRWEGTWHRIDGGTRGHAENISFVYWAATSSLLENVICTWDSLRNIDYPPGFNFTGFFRTDGSVDFKENVRLLGCVGYAPRRADVKVNSMFNLGTDGCFTRELLARDCLTYVEPGRDPGQPESAIRGFITTPEKPDGTRLEHVTVAGGAGMRTSACDRTAVPPGPVYSNLLIMDTLDPGDTDGKAAIFANDYVDGVYFFNNEENFENNTSCARVPDTILSSPNCQKDCAESPVIDDSCRTASGADPELTLFGRNLLRPHTSPALRNAAPDGSDLGARIWFRYVDDVLKDGETDGDLQYLWPWPMEERIWRASLEYHLEDPDARPEPVNVTGAVLTLGGGSLPGDYTGDGRIDLSDQSEFDDCFTGADVTVSDPDCFAFDFDEDDDIDDEDRSVLDSWVGYARPEFDQYRLLRITASVDVLPVSATPVDLNGVGDATTRFTRLHLPDTSVALTAPMQTAGFVFERWEIDEQPQAAGLRTVDILMNDDRLAHAVYLPDCNQNTVPDEIDLAMGTSMDCNNNLVPDECEPDSDSDGVPDGCDGCPGDPGKTAPGSCGCGTPDTDTDGDSTLDCNDLCSNEPALVNPSEPGTELTCDDTIDNDCDGLTDAPDPDCAVGCPFACGDIDGSGGNITLVDLATFALCFNRNGPGGACPDPVTFACSDLNGNGATNLVDFATFSLLFGATSTNVPPNCP